MGGTGAREHRNEMVTPGSNRGKPLRGRGSGHATGLLTAGGKHAPLILQGACVIIKIAGDFS